MSHICEKLDAGAILPRHWHAKPYITLITHGEYIEAGDQGRFAVGPGDILIHEEFASHANWISRARNVRTLNIEVETQPTVSALCQSPNFDAVARLSKSDPLAAIDELFSSLIPKAPLHADWPDVMAKAIRDNPQTPIGDWCAHFDLAPATVSRGFKRAFGVTAARYRATARARRAYRQLSEDNLSLVELAATFGFSDQAHLTRSIRALTGAPPKHWLQVKNVQDRPSLSA